MRRADGLEVLHLDEENTVAELRRKALLHVRRGALTEAVLALVAETIERLCRTEKCLGVLVVLEPGCPVVAPSLRPQQKETVERIVARANLRMAPVVLGQDVVSSLNRSAGRMVLAGHPRVRNHTVLAEAAAWLAEELTPLGFSLTVKDLEAALATLRKLEPARGGGG